MPSPRKQSRYCTLLANSTVTAEIFRLDFAWPGPAPRAGQFFMVKPERSGFFLPRPISVALWEAGEKKLSFFITPRGRATAELAQLKSGDRIELSGPLGNSWEDFLVNGEDPATGIPAAGAKPLALIGGGVGVAPLLVLAAQFSLRRFDSLRRVHTPSACGGVVDFYAGFKTNFINNEEKSALLGPAEYSAAKLVIAAEEDAGGEVRSGRIPDFLEPAKYTAVCACGPEAMLLAVAERCRTAAVPCYISMERRMACGAGACLGCTVQTARGNRRCCADGPIFPAEEIYG